MPNHRFQSETFRISTLDCSQELSLIRTGIGHLPGIHKLRPDYLNRSLHVEYDPEQIAPQEIAQQLQKIGFPAQSSSERKSSNQKLVSGDLPRVSSILGGLLLLVATLSWWYFPEMSWAAVLATLATIVAGVPVVKSAYRAVRLGRLDMNALMTVAATGAIATGEYFEAATAMCLFGLSIWLESFSLNRARRAVQTLLQLTPTVAHRLQANNTTGDNSKVDDIDPCELKVDDRVLVKPGERVPIDAKVVSGHSTVNQAPITGESMPIEKNVGDSVYAGSLNGEGSLVILASRTAHDSTLAHIARLVQQAQSSQSPTERSVDRFARIYTPLVIALAVCLAFVPPWLAWLGVDWAAGQEFQTWFHRGLVLLVIACPCALVISTPVTIVCGLHQATRHGILVKGGEYLEEIALADCVAFDKTGTITTGNASVVEVRCVKDHTPEEVLRIAASLESHSEHPLARAIVQETRNRGLDWKPAEHFESLRGFGVRGALGGETYLVVSPEYYASGSDRLETSIDDWQLCDNSYTIALVGTSRKILGAIYLADQARPHAAEAIADLRRLGIKQIVMLTGDRVQVAESIAKTVGIEQVHAGLLPEEKVSRVEQLAARYPHLIMVGDGVNDAPALASSRVGIALGSQASDTALETADVVMLRPQLNRIGELIRLGRRTRRRLSENIFIALAIKLVVLLLAAAGIATMWMAVAADVGASMLVIFNGMRILQKDKFLATEFDDC